MLDWPRMLRPSIIVCAGTDLFHSFFPPVLQRRLSRLSRWQRAGSTELTSALRRKLGSADALVTTWDSPAFSEDLPKLAPKLRFIAHCGGEVMACLSRYRRFLSITKAPAGPARRSLVARLEVRARWWTLAAKASRRPGPPRPSLVGMRPGRCPPPKRCPRISPPRLPAGAMLATGEGAGAASVRREGPARAAGGGQRRDHPVTARRRQP